MTIQEIKNRFGIIGSSALLDRALATANQVAPTDISVLVTGESGTGKEVFSKIIHQLSARKHGPYIAVNCGAIPEGTIDSELFGHEKGSFTGAHEARKGYFEVADNGTIFLDEVAELPLSTQVRLLRVLETGEFIKVGSSKAMKTNVRIVGATNVNMAEAISKGKFREDLYYRLNTVPIYIPSLKHRKEDIPILFRKFASDFADKYRMPQVKLDDEANLMLVNYSWPGNIRQLKNLAEQISIIEKDRIVSPQILLNYMPHENNSQLPAIYKGENATPEFSERDLLYKVLFDMKKDIIDLKKLVFDMIRQEDGNIAFQENNAGIIQKLYNEVTHESVGDHFVQVQKKEKQDYIEPKNEIQEPIQEHQIVEEEKITTLSEMEKDMIKRVLAKNNGKRKFAAIELDISERTLYRKMKDFNLT